MKVFIVRKTVREEGVQRGKGETETERWGDRGGRGRHRQTGRQRCLPDGSRLCANPSQVSPRPQSEFGLQGAAPRNTPRCCWSVCPDFSQLHS